MHTFRIFDFFSRIPWAFSSKLNTENRGISFKYKRPFDRWNTSLLQIYWVTNGYSKYKCQGHASRYLIHNSTSMNMVLKHGFLYRFLKKNSQNRCGTRNLCLRGRPVFSRETMPVLNNPESLLSIVLDMLISTDSRNVF